MRAHNSYIQPTRRSRHRRIPVLMGGAIPFKDYADGIEGFDWLHLDELTGDIAFATNSALALGRRLTLNWDFANWTGAAPNDQPDEFTVTEAGDATSKVTENPAGQCEMISDGTALILQQNVPTSYIGKSVKATIVVATYTSGGITPQIGTAIQANITSAGTFTYDIPVLDAADFFVKRQGGVGCDLHLSAMYIEQTGIPASEDYSDAELYVTANAASDPNGNEADGLGNMLTGNGILTSDATVKAFGSYSLKFVVAIANARSYEEIGSTLALVIGKRYTLTFWTRHIGSGGNVNIYLASINSQVENLLTTVTVAETTFRKVTLEFIHGATTQFLVLRESNATNDGGVYIDNISFVEVNPMNVRNTGMNIGNPGTGNVKLIYLGDGATTGLEYDTIAEWNSKYNPDKLTAILVVRVDDWGAGTDVIWRLAVDANTELVLEKRASELAWRYNVEGNFDEVTFNTATLPGGSPAGLFTMAITVDTDGAGEIVGYMKGIARGTSTITGEWIGNFDPAECAVFAGDNGQGGSLDGGGAHVGLGNRVMTPAEVQQFDQRSGL